MNPQQLHHLVADTDPRVLEKQELQQPTYVALSYINRFMTDAARREQESLKKKIQPKLSLTLSSSVSRGNVSTPPRHSSGSLTPPVTPPITPSSSFRSSTPTGSEYDEEEVDYEESDSDESWTTESAISSEAILSSMCMNGGEEKPFACPVPGCKKRYKNTKRVACLCHTPSPAVGLCRWLTEDDFEVLKVVDGGFLAFSPGSSCSLPRDPTTGMKDQEKRGL
ncbi:juxtaposed with another zinc finger protein 1 isoform X3 [Mirounga angustirostris]|uniref:juxtaposed with another zinc finger protein 1 isoform X3 n=1 Tax=Mirounga angustirostris TaxID=9716 RepID=UPI00313AC781